ncbi:MAG: hypothetical protein FWC89_02295 [Defluviitaleaceae bacterium]|nr:hypothetical protein [Defluviitaleaceae bacterium]
MALRNFEWRMDERNNAVLTWEWPSSPVVKLMLVFKWDCDEASAEPQIPDVEALIRDGVPHEVVSRDLQARFSAKVSQGKRKYLVALAYFNDNKGITICKPTHVTDWLFRKTTVTTSVACKPVPLSQYQKVSLRVKVSDESDIPQICKILKYAIHEQGRTVGEYPLDAGVMSGMYHFYIKKDQTVKFLFDEKFCHLFDLRRD